MGNGRVGRKREDGCGPKKKRPKGWFTPHVRNPKKYPDCRTDLIGGGGNTDVCPGGKHPRAATVKPQKESNEGGVKVDNAIEEAVSGDAIGLLCQVCLSVCQRFYDFT